LSSGCQRISQASIARRGNQVASSLDRGDLRQTTSEPTEATSPSTSLPCTLTLTGVFSSASKDTAAAKLRARVGAASLAEIWAPPPATLRLPRADTGTIAGPLGRSNSKKSVATAHIWAVACQVPALRTTWTCRSAMSSASARRLVWAAACSLRRRLLDREAAARSTLLAAAQAAKAATSRSASPASGIPTG